MRWRARGKEGSPKGLRYAGGLACAILVAQAFRPAFAQQLDWRAIEEETMRHYQALVRIDTTSKERPAAEYVKKVLDDNGIPAQLLALEPDRPNVLARLKGSGAKRPLLIMGHTDTVTVDASKWKFPPFSATRDGGTCRSIAM
jgi:acetylornithine deacetylase/succinyl-diaminopimelate desuccinylase-like protein